MAATNATVLGYWNALGKQATKASPIVITIADNKFEATGSSLSKKVTAVGGENFLAAMQKAMPLSAKPAARPSASRSASASKSSSSSRSSSGTTKPTTKRASPRKPATASK